MKLYKAAALVLAACFLLVGALFLAFPGGVLSLFNRLSRPLGLPASPIVGPSFFLVLTSGYMYLVSILAWLMFRHPENRLFSFLLVQGKLATSLLSLGFFIIHRPYLLYLANFLVDGLIAGAVWGISKVRDREIR
jgi:hypothetical protein